MTAKKLTDKLTEGKNKGQEVAQVIETDVNHIKDLLENYGLLLTNCAYAFYVFHLERAQDSVTDTMY